MSLLDNFQAAVARVESCRSKINDLQQKRDELDRELYHLEQDMAREADARDKLKLIIDSKLDQCSAPAAPEPLPTVDTSGWTLPKKEEEEKAPKAKPLKRERASRVREGTLIHSVLCTIRDYGPMSGADACKKMMGLGIIDEKRYHSTEATISEARKRDYVRDTGDGRLEFVSFTGYASVRGAPLQKNVRLVDAAVGRWPSNREFSVHDIAKTFVDGTMCNGTVRSCLHELRKDGKVEKVSTQVWKRV